ncbi:MAG TPA: spore coat protein U domain-containing protein [Gallionellaceae bacterium]
MKKHPALILLSLACGFCLPVHAAYAVYDCIISSPGWSAIYDPQSATANTTTSSVTINCSRAIGKGGDPANMNYTLEADHGWNPAGTVNQARLLSGASLLQYNEYTDAATSMLWGPAPNAISGALKFGGSASASTTVTFYAKTPALQNVAPGSYSDTVTMTLTYSALITSNVHLVTITVNPVCAFSTPPGNITFNYTSFQATAATASTSFATLCTNTLPYTMSLDTTSATLLGLTYTLSAPTGTYIGTGIAQTYSISGTIAAGQSGTCATATCSGTAVHTLIINY